MIRLEWETLICLLLNAYTEDERMDLKSFDFNFDFMDYLNANIYNSYLRDYLKRPNNIFYSAKSMLEGSIEINKDVVDYCLVCFFKDIMKFCGFYDNKNNYSVLDYSLFSEMDFADEIMGSYEDITMFLKESYESGDMYEFNKKTFNLELRVINKSIEDGNFRLLSELIFMDDFCRNAITKGGDLYR